MNQWLDRAASWAGAFLLALLAFGLLGLTQAADFAAPRPAAPWAVPVAVADPANRWEARFGVFAHGVGSVEEGTVAINGEFVSPRLFYATGPWGFLVPRVHVGGFVNVSGLTNSAYTGLLWTLPVFDRWFVEAFVGPSMHDGALAATATRAGLGCDVLFNAGASVGYRWTENWSVMATFNHLSNGKTLFGINCGTNQAATGSNQGFNHYGVRVGYAF